VTKHSQKYRRKPSPANDGISTFAEFRRLLHTDRDINSGIARYRGRLAIESVHSVVCDMMKNSIYRNALTSSGFPNDYGKMKSGKVLTVVSQDIELMWTSSILYSYHNDLKLYINLRNDYTNLFMTGAFDLAQTALQSVVDRFGYSLWSIFASITLAQTRTGTKLNKELVDTIVSTPGINQTIAYLAFYYSYTAESGVFSEDLRAEFSSNVHPILRYLAYHLVPGELQNVKDPCACIRYENNSPIIDRFETFVEMSQLLYLKGESRSTLKSAVSLLVGLGDIRIENLAFLLDIDGAPPTEDVVFTAAYEEYTRGEYQRGADRLMGGAIRDGAAWRFELAARIQSVLKQSPSETSPADQIIHEFRSFLDVSKDLAETRAALDKCSLLTRKLSSSRAIMSLIDRQLDVALDRQYTINELIWCLSSPLILPIHFSILRALDEKSYLRLLELIDDRKSVAQTVHVLCSRKASSSATGILQCEIPVERKTLYCSYAAYNAGDIVNAFMHYNNYRRIVDLQLNPRVLSFQYAILKRQDLIEEALAAFSSAYLSNERLHALYPLPELAEWAVSKAATNSSALDRAIMLHAVSSHSDLRQVGDLSNSFEDVLDFYKIDRPYLLVNMEIDFAKLVFFLRFVSTVDRLEDTTRFESFDEIESERMRILQWLVANDNANKTAYTLEISAITKDQEVARVSARFERSKIYIHEDGIRRLFENEVRPGFLRFRNLIADPQIGQTIEHIDRNLRRLLKDSDDIMKYITLPSTELDSVFNSLLTKAIEIIVMDPNHGFKTYLSTRLLHGVLEGELRSSFVNERILVSVDRFPLEQFIEIWSAHLRAFDETRKKEIAHHFVRFSKKITDAISRLKDVRIRVWAVKAPEGLFKFELLESGIELLKRSVSPTTTYEEFVDRLMASFWESMDEGLRLARLEISIDFRKQIFAAFDSLEASLLRDVPYGLSEFLDAIARSRAAFSISIERVAAWFSRAGIQSREPFSIETAVQVATLITNNCYPQFPLRPFYDEDKETRVSGELLNPLIDLLSNCFQNASEHSGFMDRAPSISVVVEHRAKLDIQVKVVAELSSAVDPTACGTEIRDLVEEGDDANPTAVAGEGRTGIRKMKRIVRYDFQSPRRLTAAVEVPNRVVVIFSIPGHFENEHSSH
jgi:hypothetical protein